MRIVSLLPSATEIVCSLGLQDQIVGVSHSCNYPEGVADLPVLTRTTVPKDASSREIDDHVRRYLGDHSALYQLDLEELTRTRPQVVVSQRLCDVCAVNVDDVTAALGDLPGKPQLVDLEPEVLDDVFGDILRVGAMLNAVPQAQRLVRDLKQRRTAAAERTHAIPLAQRPRVAMLEWLVPPFNSGHWNPELVELAGGIDCLGPHGKPSATISWDTVLEARPQVIFLACCGFDCDRTIKDLNALGGDPQWQNLIKKTGARVLVTDGDAYFSRPGPRLIDGMEALAHALHPIVHPPTDTEAQVLEITPGLT